ncbi:hypothetical protein [Quadrisphaera setariae]|uniref:Uncharacterized protein n=1 Tax=Quadrisphaera setariae TaxID=2593304 RepID=A0A5C8ZJP6_9ACTN|nr:hypothetical protein [Quadrisphaera setariae]TXR57398.1 hypothetical protein FMM08_03865 [Quadrisphaera setariae]
MALPMVIGLMLVSALLVMGVTAVSLTAAGSASGTRASIQSQASAEAGLAAAQSNIMAKTYACTFASPVGSTPVYSVAVQYGVSTGGPDCPAPAGALTTVSAKTAVLVSTGSAAAGGTQGHSAGDVSRLEVVLSLGGTTIATSSPTSAPSPAFDRAVFVGSGSVKSSGNWALKNGSSSTGGLYVNGTLDCSQINVQGPAVVYGSAGLNGGNCVFGQGLTISQDLTACTSTKITGTLTVGGQATGGCSVDGDVYVGKDFACSSSVTGLISVQGAMNGGWGCSAGKDLRVGGDLGQNSYSVTGAVVSTSGTVSSNAQGSMGSLTVKTKPSSSPGNLTVAGKSCGWGSSPACKISQSSSSSTPPTSPVAVPSSAEAMPVYTAASFGTATPWATLIRQRYLAHGSTQWAETRFVNSGDTCSITAPASVQQDGDSTSLNGPLDAPADVSVVDARACSTVTLNKVTVQLNGDLTLLVNSFYSTSGIKVVKGSAVPTGTTPVLRIVSPMSDGTSTCAANSANNSIKFDSAAASLGSDVSMLLYSSGKIDMSNDLSFYGQMISCAIPELKNNISINYRAVAPSSASTSSSPSSSSGSPSNSGSSAGAWTLSSVRDLSRG